MKSERYSVQYGEHRIDFAIVRRERTTLEIAVEPDGVLAIVFLTENGTGDGASDGDFDTVDDDRAIGERVDCERADGHCGDGALRNRTFLLFVHGGFGAGGHFGSLGSHVGNSPRFGD